MDKSVTKLQAIAMLKSLRPSWKPSERQLTKLYCIAECIPDDDAKVLKEPTNNSRNFNMEIPNSIVIFLDNDPRWYDATRFRKFDKSSLQEYTRKDLLLEWAKKELENAKKTDFDDFGRGEVITWERIIDKLNSL